MARLRRRSERLSSDNRQHLRLLLGKLSDLPCDPLKKLSEDEAAELYSLLKASTGRQLGEVPEGRRSADLAALSAKDRKRAELLIERSAGPGYEGSFANERATAEHRRQMSELAVRARRTKRVTYEEPGSVVLPAAFVEHLHNGVNRPEHAVCFLYVIAQLEGGRAFARGARIEGEALVIPSGQGLTVPGGDPESVLIRWPTAIKHLETNNWLAVERLGSELRIRRGSRWLKHVEARDGTFTKKEEVAA